MARSKRTVFNLPIARRKLMARSGFAVVVPACLTAHRDGQVVIMQYTLRADDAKCSTPRHRMSRWRTCTAPENIVPGLEKALTGKAIGTRAKSTVSAAEATASAKTKAGHDSRPNLPPT